MSCSTDSEEGNLMENDPIVGDWEIIESGGALSSGETFVDTDPCSNTQKHSFYPDGTFDSEIWWGDSDTCAFDQIRTGEWFNSPSNVNPKANYRLVYHQIPSDDEEVGFPEITFSGNTMRIEYDHDSTFDYTYRTYQKQ